MMPTTKLSLEEIATKFGEAYFKEKTGKADADKYKKQLYAHFDGLLDAEEFLVELDAVDEAEAHQKATRLHPGCIVDDIRKVDEVETYASFEIIMRENVSLKGYTYVNATDGKVYGRTIRSGGTYLDDELMREEDPALWKSVMEIPNRTFLENLMYECGIHHTEVADKLDRIYDDMEGPPRVLKDMSSLDAEAMAAIQSYVFQEPPKVAIAPVRDAKDEELEGLDGE
jgi:hypothetical protein